MQIELISITPNSDKVIESVARTCWDSFDKTTPESAETLLSGLLKKGHLSPFEFATAGFRIRGGSRAFTHQLVRHRLCSFAQRSQRYVDESKTLFVVPESIGSNYEALGIYRKAIADIRNAYDSLKNLGIPKEDARMILPNATTSEIAVSANFREWRHIFDERCTKNAQWEIRDACYMILEILQREAPLIFGDYELDPTTGTAKSRYGGKIR